MGIFDKKSTEASMYEQDDIGQESARKYIEQNGVEDDKARSGMKNVNDKSGAENVAEKYLVKPFAKVGMKIFSVFSKERTGDKNHSEKLKADSLGNKKLAGGSATSGDSSVKGFDKKWVYGITCLFVTILVGSMYFMPTNDSSKKKETVNDDVKRGAITGSHVSNMPKDYSEYAEVRRKQLAEEERKKAEAAAKKEAERNASKSDPTPVSVQAKINSGKTTTNAYDRVEINRPVAPVRDVETEARLAELRAYREYRKAAMASPIEFELKRR